MKKILLIVCALAFFWPAVCKEFFGQEVTIPTPALTGTATPAGSATPTASAPNRRTESFIAEPRRTLNATTRVISTENIVCDFFYANWGKDFWPGTKVNPWSYRAYYKKRGLKGKWVCEISVLPEEVNGK